MKKNFQRNILVVVGCLLLAGCSKDFIQPKEVKVIDVQKAKKVNVSFDALKADIVITGGTQRLMAAKFNYFMPTNRTEVQYHEEGEEGGLVIFDKFNPSIGVYPTTMRLNLWTVVLNEKMPFIGRVRLKEGQLICDARKLNIERLDLELGKVSGRLDLTKTWTKSFYADLNVEDGRLLVRIPKDVGVRVELMDENQSITAEGFKRDGRILTNEVYQEEKPALRFYVHPGQGKIIFESPQ